MNSHITLLGLNHRTATVDVREKYALAACGTPENWGLPKGADLRESFILSTCNRVEMLGVGNERAKNCMLSRWAAFCHASISDLASYLYEYHNLEAVKHVFEVASSLDSMILGEPQILGQLKAAYRNAVNAKSTGSILNRIMHRAFFVAKRVRNETAVAASAVSISYAAVELAKRIFGAMPSHRALLIGAGEMAELAAAHLMRAGIDQLLVSNRTFAHAENLAARFHGIPLPFDNIIRTLDNVDIILSSTGAPETIISAHDVRKALKSRRNRPMFFIDIAVPRDIDPEVNTLDNVYLYDIDDLKEVVEENRATRQEEAEKARLIIDEEVREFAHWLDTRKLDPTIRKIVSRGEAIADAELAKTLKKIGPVSPELRNHLQVMAYAIAHKLNHDPIMYLKKDPEDNLAPINVVSEIFNLGDQQPPK